jgi:hypothetical protein
VVLQQRELALARTEFQRTANALEQENFEATFFRLSSLVQETASAITIDGNSGAAAFKHFHNRMHTHYKTREMPTHHNSVAAYQSAYDQAGYVYAQYFRVLYNAFRYLSSKKEQFAARFRDEPDSDDLRVNVDAYAKLLRAQLSDYELVILLYNSTSPRGANMRRYLEEFAILDNLDSKYLLAREDRGLVGEQAWGNNKFD